MCDVKVVYNRRMGSIEDKFRAICERYYQLTQELALKNEAIAAMTQQMALLEGKLEEANSTIAELKKHIIKAE
jgi:septal ring factor EnvC (AmiA/AmiB activator)